MDINIKVNKATRDAIPDKNKIGVEGENLQEKLVFYFEDEFVDGVARLEYEQDGVKNYIPLTKIDQTYVVPIKNVITKPWKLNLQLVITENEQSEGIPLFKSDMFEVYITNSINAVGEAPEGYDLWIDIANAKLLLMDEKIDEANDAIENISTAIQETENLDLDVNKTEKETTVEITKKDGITKSVKIYDGVSLQFMWQGTSLGIKTDDMEEYIFVNLQGIQGVPGPQGEPFRIKKTYSSVAEMYADFDNMNVGDYVMIATSVEIEDNAKLYTKGDLQWIFITDFSGAMGIKGETGATPIIHIGTVTSGDEPSVTISGTAENPIFNFVLKPGPQGQTGATGETGATGNGIATIIKTSTSGLVDTYTITYTNGNTTTFNVTNGEDGEVTQTQLDETNAEVERAMMVYNALPKVTEIDTEITLNGTANCPMKLKLNPSELTQETTTGANLQKFNARTVSSSGAVYTCDYKGQITVTGTATSTVGYGYNLPSSKPISLEAGTYTAKIIGTKSSNTRIYREGNINLYFDSNNESTFTLESNTTTFSISTQVNPGVHNDNFYITLTKGTVATTERYTGGIPQPNPEFPSEVQVIKGNNSIKIENKNLFNLKSFLTERGVTYTENADGGLTFTTSSALYLNPLQFSNEDIVISLSGNLTTTETMSNSQIEILNSNNVVVGQINLNSSKAENITGCKLRFNMTSNKTITLKAIQVEKDSTASTYTAHQEQVLPLNLPVENLFDISKISANTFINTLGEAGVSSASNVSDYIKVKSGNKFTLTYDYTTMASSSERAYCYYDENKTYISGNSYIATNKSTTFTIPNNAFYIRFGYDINCTNIKFAEGTTTQYVSDNPIEYCKTGTYEDEFVIPSDKNMFDEKQLLEATGWTYSNGYYNGTFANFNNKWETNGFSINIDNSKQHTLSLNYYVTGGNAIIRFVYSDNTYTGISLNSTTPTNITMTSTEGKTITKIMATYGSGGSNILYIKNMQLEQNIVATEYEPYNPNGKWYLKKYIDKVVLDGSESSWLENSATKGLFQITLSNVYDNFNTINAMANWLKGVNGYGTTIGNINNSISTYSSNRLFFRIDDYRENLTGLKTYLASHNLIAYYVLSTPTHTEITDTTLLSQLNAIEKALSYDEQTNISQTNAGLPFRIKASAVRSLANIFDLINE